MLAGLNQSLVSLRYLPWSGSSMWMRVRISAPSRSLRSRAEGRPAGFELCEVVRLDELGGEVGPPCVDGVLQAHWRAAALLPCAVVGDAIEIRVQLEERARRVAQVPVEVGACEV